MSETKEFWSGDFGDQYLKRNRIDWRKRFDFWIEIMAITGARSVFEVGANAGWNLTAIKNCCYWKPEVYGCDLNAKASDQAKLAGLNVFNVTLEEFMANNPPCELVFTAGVLIHVAPEDIETMMKNIIDASSDYVLAIEYEAERETEVEYRGHKGKLWKRPYGNMYELMGLNLVETGLLGEKDGFDPNGVTYWLLRKN